MIIINCFTPREDKTVPPLIGYVKSVVLWLMVMKLWIVKLIWKLAWFYFSCGLKAGWQRFPIAHNSHAFLSSSQ